MNYPIDRRLFSELAGLDPADVCKRAVCSYDTVHKRYSISVWRDIYIVSANECNIECVPGNGPVQHEYFSVFLIHHLLKAPEAGPVNEWISEKDVPGGVTFFRGPHQIPTGKISRRFGNDTDLFSRKCDQLGGHRLTLADASSSFLITPRTPVAVLYWRGDDEFPPEVKILFDRSLAGYLAADAIYALAVDICERISR
jgi:hypothetical protein